MSKLDSEFEFVGKGKMDGKNVEITFKTQNCNIERTDMFGTPKFIIYPMLNKEDKTFFKMTTEGNNKKGFDVEITIKQDEFVRVRVTNNKTGEVLIRVPQHFEGDWEEHARKVAQEMIDQWKTKVIKYTVD